MSVQPYWFHPETLAQLIPSSAPASPHICAHPLPICSEMGVGSQCPPQGSREAMSSDHCSSELQPGIIGRALWVSKPNLGSRKERKLIIKTTLVVAVDQNKMNVFASGTERDREEWGKSPGTARLMVANIWALFHFSLSLSFLSLLSLPPHSISALIFHSACL